MVKICHVTNVHDTNDVRIFRKECVSLAKKKEYEVFLVGPGSEDKEISGVKIIGAGQRPLGRKDRMLKFAPAVIKKAMELDADIYHLHDPELIRFALNFKKIGKKVIFDSHENVLDSIDEKSYLPLLIRKIIKRYYHMLQKRVFPKIDGIIVVSPQMIEKHRLFNKNVLMICNFPLIDNIDNFKVVKPVKGRFIFAGGVKEEWSHKEILSAIEDIDGIEYRIYGAEEENYVDELKMLKGWEKTYYGGKIPFNDVQLEIKKAQFCFALLKPGKNSFNQEGTLGNTKLFEAMANGKPVIASNFILWKEIVEKNNCGICVNPDDKDEISSAIRYLLNCDRDTVEKMGENGIKAIKDKFNWSIEEEKLFLFYDKLCIENECIR